MGRQEKLWRRHALRESGEHGGRASLGWRVRSVGFVAGGVDGKVGAQPATW